VDTAVVEAQVEWVAVAPVDDQATTLGEALRGHLAGRTGPDQPGHLAGHHEPGDLDSQQHAPDVVAVAAGHDLGDGHPSGERAGPVVTPGVVHGWREGHHRRTVGVVRGLLVGTPVAQQHLGPELTPRQVDLVDERPSCDQGVDLTVVAHQPVQVLHRVGEPELLVVVAEQVVVETGVVHVGQLDEHSVVVDPGRPLLRPEGAPTGELPSLVASVLEGQGDQDAPRGTGRPPDLARCGLGQRADGGHQLPPVLVVLDAGTAQVPVEVRVEERLQPTVVEPRGCLLLQDATGLLPRHDPLAEVGDRGRLLADRALVVAGPVEVDDVADDVDRGRPREELRDDRLVLVGDPFTEPQRVPLPEVAPEQLVPGVEVAQQGQELGDGDAVARVAMDLGHPVGGPPGGAVEPLHRADHHVGAGPPAALDEPEQSVVGEQVVGVDERQELAAGSPHPGVACGPEPAVRARQQPHPGITACVPLGDRPRPVG
jgi:hypothetical protein